MPSATSTFGAGPSKRALARLQEVKALHEENLARYEGNRREREVELWEGRISDEACLGTLLTLGRGIGAERSYVELCVDAKEVLSSNGKDPEPGADAL